MAPAPHTLHRDELAFNLGASRRAHEDTLAELQDGRAAVAALKQQLDATLGKHVACAGLVCDAGTALCRELGGKRRGWLRIGIQRAVFGRAGMCALHPS